MRRSFSTFISESTSSALGLVALIVVSLCALGLLGLLGLVLSGVELSPYLGIVTFMVLPGGLILGLILVAAAHVRRRRAELRGEAARWHLNLDDPEHRKRLALITVLTVVNLLILGITGYHGVHFMDSAGFCGKTCHKVMEPEFTAYQNSPHAKVECTDCHIGPGTSWFVKSKLSGSKQVLAVAFHTYPRPIPAPIHNLRPARETCEQCHWPAKFHGDRIKVLQRFQEDEANTELKTVLLLKVGGGSLESGFAEGIHWHMNLANRIEYRASPDRRTVYWVRVQDLQGRVREYWHQDVAPKRDSILALPPRSMDCIDCHNRPTHAYQLPSDALDEALQRGRVARDLPYVKRECMRLLQTPWPSKAAALAAFPESLAAFYGRDYPEVAVRRGVEIAAAAEQLRAIYGRNVFPEMRVGWGTYQDQIGHRDDGGCFRCHDEQHLSEDGKTISQDCSTCHSLLAFEEADPTVMHALYGPR